MTRQEKLSSAYDSISDAMSLLNGIVGENFMKRLEEISDAISRELGGMNE